MRSGELGRRVFRQTCLACRGEERVLDPCPACEGTGYAQLRCRDCFVWKPVGVFLRGGRLLARCSRCRGGEAPKRGPIVRTGTLLVRWCLRSKNRKTGPIPVSMTSPRTCPPGCPWLGRGCYGEQDFSGLHFRRLARGRGLSWDDFCKRVEELPEGQLWRHNEAGDLPGDGGEIDEWRLLQLVRASRHATGFTYTHKPLLGDDVVARANRRKLREARAWSGGGFVVNLSADGLSQADQLCDLEGRHPVVVVLPESCSSQHTPAGRRVVICPALGNEATSCLTCELCARPERDFLVGFPAHGNLRKRMSERLTQLRLF
jgi:hypothetical protein